MPTRPEPGVPGPTRPLALYDADCGFCTRCAGILTRRVPTIALVSIQGSDLAALGVDAGRALVEMPLVRPDGSVAYGHEAWAEILRAAGGPLAWLGRALGSRALRRPAAALYGWVARNRRRLPGGSASCALPTQPPA